MKLIIIIISFVLAAFVDTASAQEQKEKNTGTDMRSTDSLKKQAAILRSYTFSTTDAVKFGKVAEIQNQCKEELNKLAADSMLKPEDQRYKMQMLIEQRNLKLSKILTPAELKVLIPAMPRLAPVRVNKPVNLKTNPQP